MPVFIDFIKCLFSGFFVGVCGVASALPIYDQLSGIQEQLYAALLGVPVGLITAISTTIFVVKAIKKLR